jgi:hydroxylamine reductase (hybrid-cluster protein)
MCGKPEDLANLHDLLIYVLRGISIYGEKARELGVVDKRADMFIAERLFSTITNVNWKNEWFVNEIREGLKIREELKTRFLASYKAKKTVRSSPGNYMMRLSGIRMTRRNLTKRQNPWAFLPRKMKMCARSGSF